MALSIDQFRDQLIASGLLPAEDVSSILTALPVDKQPQDGEQLARELVRQKKLTKFQAEQIYLGKGKSLVLGNYTILDKLGQGGMGMVLKAEHKRLKRLVALKVLSPAALKTPDALKRFHREVEAAAKLRHTNVVATDDADEAKGTHFLVMEYVAGSDLSALVKKKGPLSVSQALQCILQAARGLEYAHEQGVVHRDIKPANLLLDAKGTVKILDMGLARIEGDSAGRAELTSTGAVMGTVDYMAPEQALSTKTADARSDIYSLGISLWYLLTGKCAYDGDTLMAKLLAHRDGSIPSLTAVRNEVSAAIDAVFQKMVAKQAKDRYQSMTEVIRDLEACQSGASSTSSLSVSTVDDDANPFSFLNNLGGPASSVSNTHQSPPTTTRQVQPTATSVAADAAAEATMLTGDMAQTTDPQTLTSIRASSSPKNRSRSKTVVSPPWWQDRRVQIGGGAAAVLLMLAVVFLFQTPNGTLRVEILDPEVEMKVKGTELTFHGSDLEPVSLKAGEKKLLVTRGDLSFETEGFTLKKGTETRVKVELQGDKLVVNGGGKVIAEQPVPRKGLTTSTTGSDRAFSQWLKDVQAMPAEKQLEAVSKKLVELNPGFDGKLFHSVDGGRGQGVPKIENGVVTELHFYTDKVTDLSPVRALTELKVLSAFPTNFASELNNLAPLQRMPLTELTLSFNSKLSDVSPLEGMPLTKLSVFGTEVSDLTPLKEMPLMWLVAPKVSDLSPLQGMKLKHLGFSGPIADLKPLQGMPLEVLQANHTPIADLSPLKGMPLRQLELYGCGNISDVSLLHDCKSLKVLRLTETKVTAASVAALQKALPDCKIEWVAPPPAAGQLCMHDPAFPQWLKDVQAMSAQKQIAAVGKKLVECNPGFDGKLGFGPQYGDPYKIENGSVIELSFFTAKVIDISPIRALTSLRNLKVQDFDFSGNLADLSPLQGMQLKQLFLDGNSKIQDLSPLRGMPLTSLGLFGTKVSDLAPLKGMPLANLKIRGTPVTDLSPLQGMPLTTLDCNGVKGIDDLSPLKGMKLTHLELAGCQVVDFSPLAGMPLETLWVNATRFHDMMILKGMPLKILVIENCPHLTDLSLLKEFSLHMIHLDFKAERDTETLRSMKSLDAINGKLVADFWKEVEKQQKGK